MSEPSDAYVRKFRSILRLFPSRFRARFEPEMVQTLRDQLAHAERANDPHLLREVYLSAMADVPAAALRERLRILPPTRNGWLAMHVVLLGSIVVAGFGLAYGDWPLELAGFTIAAVSIAMAAWGLTRRISIGAFVLGLGVLGLFLASGAADSAWLNDSAFFDFFVGNSSWVALLGLLLPYGALVWMRLHSERFWRSNLDSLDDAGLSRVSAANRRIRRFVWRAFTWGLAIIVAANVASLLDNPPVNFSLINPPNHIVARQNNAYYVLESAPLSSDMPDLDLEQVHQHPAVKSLLYGYVKGTAPRNQSEADTLLRENAQGLADFQAASRMAGYQDPNYQSVTDDQPWDNFSFVDALRYGDLEDLDLIAAEQDIRSGNPDLATQRIAESMNMARMIAKANDLDLLEYFAVNMEITAVTFASDLPESALNGQQRAEIQASLPGEHESWQDARDAIRTEASIDLSGTPGLYPGNGYFHYSFPYLPYDYRPQRTANLEIADYQAMLNMPDGSCGGVRLANVVYGPLAAMDLLTYNGLGRREEGIADISYQPQCRLQSAIQAFDS